jgi:DNA-binding PadR family transcriptional regulator
MDIPTAEKKTRRPQTPAPPAPDPGSLLPLRPLVFELLLLLGRSEQHGYALMRALAERTERRYELGPATLYRTLKELRVQGLIEEAASPPGTGAASADSGEDRRRTYRLTDFGRAVASAEASRLDALVADAKAARLLRRPLRARRNRV